MTPIGQTRPDIDFPVKTGSGAALSCSLSVRRGSRKQKSVASSLIRSVDQAGEAEPPGHISMMPSMEENTAATVPASAGYQIDDLIVDLGRQRVTCAGVDIPLPRLSFDLLVTLARAAPDLVSFDELNRRVWPGLVITPETISQRVKLVRDALGDDSHAPRYIGGVRGRGYRMVALVRPLTNRRSSAEGSSLADATGPIAVEPEPSPRDEAIAPSVLASRRAVAAAAVASPGDTGGAAKPVVNLTQQPPITRPASHRVDRLVLTISVLIALGLGYFAADKLWLSGGTTSERPVATVAPATTPVTPAVSDKSVAVLPFLDMSEKKDQEYFSDGLTEELIDMLTKIPDLRVPAQTSSFYFKGKQATIADIARALHVAHVLEGSVRKSGNHLRITAQLVRADNGYHLWSETYDRQLDDIFKVQDEIAVAVVKALKISLIGGSSPAGSAATQTSRHTIWTSRKPYRCLGVAEVAGRANRASHQLGHVGVAHRAPASGARSSRCLATQDTRTTYECSGACTHSEGPQYGLLAHRERIGTHQGALDTKPGHRSTWNR